MAESDIELLEADGGTATSPDAAGSPPEEPAAQPPDPAAAPEPASGPEAGSADGELEWPAENADAEEAAAPEGEAAGESAGAAHEVSGEERWGPAALTRILQDHPALAQAAESHPQARAQLYEMAQRSSELAAYQEALPSLAQAQEAAQAREVLANYDQVYFGSQPEQFWRGLYEASGQTGAYERNVRFLQQTFLDGLEAHAQANGSQPVREAVQAIRQSLGWGEKHPAQPAAALPPEVRQQLQELEQLRSERAAAAASAEETFLNETASEAGQAMRQFAEGVLARARLSEYDKSHVVRDFLEAMVARADADKVHNAALEDIWRAQGMTPAARSAVLRRVAAWTRHNGRAVLEPILRAAGAGMRQRAAGDGRREPVAAGMPAAVSVPRAQDLVRQAEHKLGRRLSDREILELA